jgi:hypothetical protein
MLNEKLPRKPEGLDALVRRINERHWHTQRHVCIADMPRRQII